MLKWRASIYIFVIAFFFFSLTNVSAALSDGLVTYYTFDETSGTNILDSALGRNNGTISHVNQLNQNGILGTAMSVNGTSALNENMTVLSSQDFNFTGMNFTISFWINATKDTENNAPISKREGSNIISHNWNDSSSAGRNRFQFDNATASDFQVVGGNVTIDLFQHVVVTFNGSLNIFTEGVLRNSSIYIGELGSNSGDLVFKCDSTPCNTGTTFDEFGMWNRSLNNSEITSLYNSGLGLNPLGGTMVVTRVSPTDESVSSSANQTFNITLTPTEMNLTNSTLFVWYSNGTLFNETFRAVTGNAANSSVVILFNIPFGNFSWNVLGCGQSAIHTDCDYPTSNFTFTRSEVGFTSHTFNAQTYETSSEIIAVNITYDSSLFSSPSASLIYNGTTYAGTKSGTGETLSFSRTLIIPTTTTTKNQSFYWAVSLTNSSGVNLFNSTSQNQTVGTANLSICGGAGGNLPYLNFTFKDEGDSSALNASLDLADFTYWLSGGTLTKSYIITNSTAHGSYAFCFDPPDKTVTTDLNFKYSFTGYPIRTFQLDDQALTNTTTNQVLYLLATADGIYSTVQATEVSGTPLTGVSMTVERQFDGVWTIIGAGVGGSDGSATFWVNPNFNHRITGTKDGYVTSQVTILPSQSLYTLTMSRTTAGADFTGNLEGLSWSTSPASGYLAPGTYNFAFNLTSTLGNLDGSFCKFELVNSSQAVLGTITGGNATGCNIGISYAHIAGELLYGKVYVDTTNTTGFILIDSDNRWTDIEGTDVSTWSTMYSFFSELKDADEWGTGTHRQEWNRTVAFFLFITIAIGMFSYFTQWDAQYPGAAVLLVFVVIMVASFSGWFYIGNASLIDAGYDKIDKYVIAMLTFSITAAWYSGYLRRVT